MQSSRQSCNYDLNNKLLICYSSYGMNNRPFNDRTDLDYSNTELVGHLDYVDSN